MVSSKKMTLNAQPNNSTRCGEEWGIHGTCCEEKSALLYTFKDQNLLRQSTNLVKTALETQKQLITQIVGSLESWVSQDSQLKKQKREVFILKKRLKEIGGIGPNDHHRCWVEEMGRLRSASLCSTCSGRSESFFSEAKALISSQTCKEMLDKCYPSIKEIANIIVVVNSIYEILQHLHEKQIQGIKFATTPTSVQTLFAALDKEQVSKKLNSYSKNPEESVERQNAAVSLCEDFISLQKTPFVISIMNLMNKVTTALVSMNSITSQITLAIETKRLRSMRRGGSKKKRKRFRKRIVRLIIGNKKTHDQSINQNNQKLNNQVVTSNSIVKNYENNWNKTVTESPPPVVQLPPTPEVNQQVAQISIKVKFGKKRKGKTNKKKSKRGSRLLPLHQEPFLPNLIYFSSEIIILEHRLDSAAQSINRANERGVAMNFSLSFP